MWSFIFFASVIALIIFSYYKKLKQKENEENQKFLEELHRKEQEKKRSEEIQRQIDEMKREREKTIRIRQQKLDALIDSVPLFTIELSGEKHKRNPSIVIEPKNVTKSTSIKKIKDFIAIDVETTGLKAAGNDIIRISAIKYNDFKPVERYDTFIKPRKDIPADATQINGITNEMVKDAPLFYQIIDSLNDFLGDYPLVGHNIVFDIKHLYANGLDSAENKITYDTMVLSKRLLKDEYSYSLKSICETLDIFITEKRNSVYDSYAIAQLFISLIAERRETTVESLLDMVE